MGRAAISIRGAYQVRRGGQVVAEGAGGRRDAVTGEPCTQDTRFQAASISKQFVAASVLLLADRGALRLADPVGQWWPPAPKAWAPMTVGHLLANSSGLPHWRGIPGFDISCPPAPHEILDRVTQLPLLSPPGTRWAYSGVGYLLAAAVVEAASGQAYASFVTENVFRPLAMTATTSGQLPLAGTVARGHRDGQPVPLAAELTAMPGTGDIWTTAADLLRYADGIGGGELLSAASWQLMVSQQVPVGESLSQAATIWVSGYGYGTYIGSIGGRPAWFHTGDNPGYVSLLARFPQTGVTLAVLANDESVPLEDTAVRLVQATEQ
jgi:CubicO group peptidase (beta-lactamase class C family)